MGQRMPRGVALMFWLMLLTGCAITPIDYRVVSAPSEGIWLLAPSLRAEPQTGSGQPKLSYQYSLDIHGIVTSRCASLAFPLTWEKDTDLRAVVLAFPTGTVLRVTGTNAFENRDVLSKAWDTWWTAATGSDLLKCTSWDEKTKTQIADALQEHRPLTPGEVIGRYFGLTPESRSIVLRPGTTVCAANGVQRSTGATRFGAAGETCTNVVDDPRGGAMFDPARNILGQFTNHALAPSAIYPIASWAEIPHFEISRHYIVRYPKQMPTAPGNDSDVKYPLIFAVDATTPRAVDMALQCGKKEDDDIATFCRGSNEDFDALACAPEKNKPEKRPLCFRFGERGVITNRFTVFANGQPVEMAAGATIADFLDRMTPDLNVTWDVIGATAAAKNEGQARQRLAQSLAALRLQRRAGGQLVEVDLRAGGVGATNLPLLPGDHLSW